MEEGHNTISNARKLRLSCTNPAKWTRQSCDLLHDYFRLQHLYWDAETPWFTNEVMQEIRSCNVLAMELRMCAILGSCSSLLCDGTNSLFDPPNNACLKNTNRSISFHTEFEHFYLRRMSTTKWLPFCSDLNELTHWGRDKMAAFSQTTLSNAFSWMKTLDFRLKIHWSLFLRVQIIIFQHCFR